MMERVHKEATVVYVQVLSWNLPGWNEEIQGNLSQES
jgi:hypothetical protein